MTYDFLGTRCIDIKPILKSNNFYLISWFSRRLLFVCVCVFLLYNFHIFLQVLMGFWTLNNYIDFTYQNFSFIFFEERLICFLDYD